MVRLFVRIAETRSLSATGRSFGLSQPSSSRQLKQLEAINHGGGDRIPGRDETAGFGGYDANLNRIVGACASACQQRSGNHGA
jgi:hypothetical protein